MAAYTTIDDPSAYFKDKLFTGTGRSNADTFNDTDTDMQPDLVWIKSRDDTNEHYISDSVRGTGKEIYSSLSNAEVSDANGVTAFGSDGFTVGTGTGLNGSSDSNVAWCWKGGGSASSNSNGSITSSVSANTTSGFSVVKFDGSRPSASTVGHGLGATPSVIWFKALNAAQGWRCWFGNAGFNNQTFISLHSNAAQDTSQANIMNNTAPTSSVFTVGDDADSQNTNMIAYCFTDILGFSKSGKYTGNGNADGTFIYTGFRPAWIMIKNSSRSSENWNIIDNKRDGYNGSNENLAPNLNGAESSGNNRWDILSNGFKCRDTNNEVNNSGDTYIYMAIAEASFVNSNGVPCNAR